MLPGHSIAFLGAGNYRASTGGTPDFRIFRRLTMPGGRRTGTCKQTLRQQVPFPHARAGQKICQLRNSLALAMKQVSIRDFETPTQGKPDLATISAFQDLLIWTSV